MVTKPDWLKPEWTVVVLSLAVGLFMIFATPPFQSPDEDVHFYRAYQLSEGRVIAQRDGARVGGYLAAALQEATAPFSNMPFKPLQKVDPRLVDSLRHKPFMSEPRVFLEFMHMAIYSPVAYVPAVIGIRIAKVFRASAIDMLYAARLATLLCWIAVVFIAVRIIPALKWAVVLLALMPMTLFLASSLSADVLTNGFSILLAAVIVRSALAREDRLRWKEGLAIVLLCVLVALTKQVYFLLAVMTLMIAKGRFGSLRRKLLFCAGAVGIAIFVNLVWAWMVRGVIAHEAFADPQQQAQLILAQPLGFARVMVNTIATWWRIHLAWYVGVLGWLDTWLPMWIYPSYLLMLAAASLTDKGESRAVQLKEKLLLSAILGATLLLIAISQYLTYSFPAGSTIRGLQGRYAIPLTLPAMLLLYNRKAGLSERKLGRFVTVFCAAVLVVSCLALLNRYYGINPLGLTLKTSG